MSSTLLFRRTPKSTKELCHFKQPLKGMFARRFYDHDGSLGGGMITIGPEQLDWLRGIHAAYKEQYAGESKDLEKLIAVLEEGETIDMWFEC